MVLEVKNLNKHFIAHTRGGIEVSGFHNVHLSHYEATDIIKALAPKQARLIHISHKILESLAHINLPFAYVV